MSGFNCSNYMMVPTGATEFAKYDNHDCVGVTIVRFNLECTVTENLLGTPMSFTIYFHLTIINLSVHNILICLSINMKILMWNHENIAFSLTAFPSR